MRRPPSVELLRTAASSLRDVRLHIQSMRASLKLAAIGPRTAGCAAAQAPLAGLQVASARDRPSKREALRAGVSGFLLKDAPSSELARTLRRVMAGERVVDPELALAALSEGNNPLSSREREVLTLSLSGASIAQMAAQLFLSEGTVRNHLSMAMQKLGARNRIEAARLAQQKGWV